jgi:hypothetical protein
MNPMNITSNVIQNLSTIEWTWSLRTILVLSICSLITILTILGSLKLNHLYEKYMFEYF